MCTQNGKRLLFFAKFDRLLYSDIQTECTSLYGEFELTKKQHIVGCKGSSPTKLTEKPQNGPKSRKDKRFFETRQPNF